MENQRCHFCDEPWELGDEVGEWYDSDNECSMVGHAQCGIDSGLPLA